MELENKLRKVMMSAESTLSQEYGSLSLNGKDLFDKNGNSLYKQYGVIDRISKDLGVASTIFVREGDDYRRISTNITDASGNRVIDTMLDRKSAVYSCIQSGKEYSGPALIFGKNYLAEYQPIFASGSKDIIGIFFVGIEMS